MPPVIEEKNAQMDRRLFERFSSRFPAKLKDSREDFGSRIQLRDASAMGARIISREKFFVNDSLTLEVKLPDGQNPMNIKGAVMWAHETDVNAWSIGIKFHKVQLLQMSRLFKFAFPDAT